MLANVGAPSSKAISGVELSDVGPSSRHETATKLRSISPELIRQCTEPVILVDRMDGSALDVNVGPFQLVVEGEPRPARTIRMVARTVSRHGQPKNPDQRHPICLDYSSRSSKGFNGQSRTK